MAKPNTCVEHLDAMQTFLEDMPAARRDEDWPRLHALAAAAQTHLAAADFLWRASNRPTALDARTAQRWRDAAGIATR